MGDPTNSFEQFNYGLRPCKQIERKVMIEVLLELAHAGYKVSDYTYLGFGSPFYIDFLMFHKWLFIKKMTCLEWSDVPKRMKFNKPFPFIKLRMIAFENYIQEMRKNTKYLLWVDYDRSLDNEMLEDLSCLQRMAPQSIFIVTIDARAKLPKNIDTSRMNPQDIAQLTLRLYRQWFGNYIEEEITPNHFTPNQVPSLFYRVTRERINEVLAPRHLHFHQLFNVLYADGALMLTIGGMIGDGDDLARLQEKEILTHRYVKQDDEFLEITVPPLTIREKHWLDKRLKNGMIADAVSFEMKQAMLDNYCKFYREYPTYMEVLV